MARRKEAHGGGHGWFVTFADLMGLLVSFFVMLVAFSNQDQKKLQIVAGSMRDAFGVQTNVRYSGVIEVDGLPTRPKLKNAAHIDPEDASATPTPDEQDHKREHGAQSEERPGLRACRRLARARRCRTCRSWLKRPSTSWSKRPKRGSISISSIRRAARCLRKAPRSPTNAPAASSRSSPDRSRPRPIASRSPATPRHRKCRRGRLWSLELVRRPRQCGPPDPRGRRLAARQHLRGGRQGGHRSAVSRRSLHCRQSPRDHHADA